MPSSIPTRRLGAAKPARDAAIVAAYRRGGVSYSVLAERFGVTKAYIGKIIRNAKIQPVGDGHA